MRIVIPAIAAALAFTVGTASFAAQKQRGSQNGSQSYASDSYNRCVALAKARGYSRSDIEDNIGAARRFVQSCMRGKQQ